MTSQGPQLIRTLWYSTRGKKPNTEYYHKYFQNVFERIYMSQKGESKLDKTVQKTRSLKESSKEWEEKKYWKSKTKQTNPVPPGQICFQSRGEKGAHWLWSCENLEHKENRLGRLEMTLGVLPLPEWNVILKYTHALNQRENTIKTVDNTGRENSLSLVNITLDLLNTPI